MRHSLLMIACLLIAGCSTPTQETRVGPDEDDEALRFIVTGDTGTGEEGQHRVARGMRDVCNANGCDFVLGTGDNIYDNGVDSAYDSQFISKFERPYAHLDVPFYMVLGNHDTFPHEDGDDPGDYQVEYHYRDDRMSDKWRMPARYYNFTWGNAEFFALDTTAAIEESELHEEQLAWLQPRIRASNATWVFAFGHHPYISNGDHEDTEDGWTPLESFLEASVCEEADVYFSGHDHDLQWLKPHPECGRTQFIVSGAGARPRALEGDDHAHWFQKGETLGFFWIEVRGDTFTGHAYDGDGNLLFERSFSK